jgi:hypothetical protein
VPRKNGVSIIAKFRIGHDVILIGNRTSIASRRRASVKSRRYNHDMPDHEFVTTVPDRGRAEMAESIQDQIVREVSSWGGVTVAPHRFGGIEFKVGRRELGHLHGSRVADLPFPVRVREGLVATGDADPHHVLPESGWVSCYIRDAGDVAHVVGLFRLNYERPWLANRPS